MIKILKFILFIVFFIYQTFAFSKTSDNVDFNSKYVSNYLSAIISENNQNSDDSVKYFNSSNKFKKTGLAAIFTASLELTKDGVIDLMQKNLFGEIKISPIYQSEPVGLKGDDFYNLVVRFETSYDIDVLETKLREIEYYFGRQRNQPPHTSRTLDIDLFLFGDLISEEHNVPRNDIIKYGFVLKPLCDIEPNLIHPTKGEKIRILWEKFDCSDQAMQVLEGNIFENI